jgi:hypothetical protein
MMRKLFVYENVFVAFTVMLLVVAAEFGVLVKVSYEASMAKAEPAKPQVIAKNVPEVKGESTDLSTGVPTATPMASQNLPTITPYQLPTVTSAPQPTNTPVPSNNNNSSSPTNTPTPTSTPTPTATATPTPTPTPTLTPTPTPVPGQVTFANNSQMPHTSAWQDVNGFASISVNTYGDAGPTSSVTGYKIRFSTDQSSYTEVPSDPCGGSCVVQSFPITARYVQVVISGSGQTTSIGTLAY